MPWFILAVVVVLLASWAITRIGRVSTQKARSLLLQGAVIVDVRSTVEFASNALPGTVNVPLESISTQIARVVPRKDSPVLLHCQSGGRSGIATRILRSQGYHQAFNLGSLSNARAILATPGDQAARKS